MLKNLGAQESEYEVMIFLFIFLKFQYLSIYGFPLTIVLML
jgi:hypothetical protein